MISARFRPAALVAGLFLLAGCSNTSPAPAVTNATAPRSDLLIASQTACLIDSDCEAGHFCFQSHCTLECQSEADCGDGQVCSEHGRCLDPQKQDSLRPDADPEQAAAVPASQPTVEVIEPPPSDIQIAPGQPYVDIPIRTRNPVPGGALLYSVELGGSGKATRSLRAEGETDFKFTVPTGTAGTLDAEPAVQRVSIISSVGGYQVNLVPRIPVDGVYAGEVAIREFGGSGIPLRFGLRVEPAGATFEDATARYLLLPVSKQDLFSPVPGGDAAASQWVERPLEFDEQSQVWFARFANPFSVGADSQFKGSTPPVRAIRIEINAIEGKRVLGAVADRWLGLFDSRTADGVPAPGSVVLSGQLTASRVSPLPAEASMPVQGSGSTDVPRVGAPIALTACPPDVYSTLMQQSGASASGGPCENLAQPEAFTLAAPEQKAACALALADQALQGPSTAAQIRALLDDNVPNPGGLSFGEFLEKCAAKQGYCVPSPELLCAGQLVAHAYQTQTSELSSAGDLMERYQEVAREGYLGRQLAAFQVDTNLRLEWLKTSEAPLFLASELKAYNEDLLNRWKAQVLDAHFEVLAAQFAPSGLGVLARAPTNATAQSVRGQMLLETAQTWQGAMDALQIAAQRWNSLYQDTVSRAQSASQVRSRMFDLYLSAAVLSQLNRASGSSAANSIFGSGFAALTRSLEQLSLPFSELVFMRDAEVVVSRSVDPNDNSRTLLADREELARRAVLDAQESVDRVLTDANASKVNAQVLTDRMITQSEELRSELVQICGLPKGCSVSELDSRPECAVDVTVGRCGFVRDPQTGAYDSLDAISAQENVSEAGQAILGYRQALLDHQVAEEAFRANQERAQIELESADAFAQSVDNWDQQRRQANAEVQALLDEITALNVDAMSNEIDSIRGMQQRRAQAYEVQAAAVKQWAEIRYAGVQSDMRKMTTINALEQTGAWLTLAGDEVDRLAETTKEGYPKAVGTANDVSAPARLVIGMSAFGVTSALRAVAQGLDTASSEVELSLQEERARRDAQLNELADLASLQAQQTQDQLDAMAGELRVAQLRSEQQVSTREALIDALRRNLELDMAHDRDLVELRDRRDKVKLRLADSSHLRSEVLRTEIVASRALMQYFEVVQRAQLLQGRYASLESRLQNLNDLIASPAVIFAFANRLARAESRVERAKSLLYDWLVALEYYAVRPFVDQRMAILLARNPSQLDAIANELVRLEGACGGIVNTEVTDLSVRDDLLKIGFDVNGMTAAERFREVLARGNVPVDTQIRYSTDEQIGDLISSRKVLAATFDIRLDDFANLPQTCNAKLASVDVELVGEGLGHGRPTVSLLYDGTSALRSCQPNIDQIVGGLDPGTTSFGKITRLHTTGRSISPLANIGSYGADDSANHGLEGLPLASTYTLLIDPSTGDNRYIDWSKLEDVRLKLTWAYQDVFPVGQCQ